MAWRAKSLESLKDHRNLVVGEVAFIWDSSQQFLQSEYSNQIIVHVIEWSSWLPRVNPVPILKSKTKSHKSEFFKSKFKIRTRDSRVIKVWACPYRLKVYNFAQAQINSLKETIESGPLGLLSDPFIEF